MDDFCQYKLFGTPQPPLFTPPSYAKESESGGHTLRKRVPTLHLRASDPSKLLLLAESLKDQCTLDLELKINNYLIEQSECDCAFLACFITLPDMAVIQLIGSRVLREEIHIPSEDLLLLDIIANKNGKRFTSNLLPAVICDQIRLKSTPDVNRNVTAFPIFAQKHRNGVTETTGTIVYVVFIVNSSFQPGMLYHLVSECFRFALPILTNTAAFERQSNIKMRMQLLLQMGPMLFKVVEDRQHLIALIGEKGKEMFDSERCDVFLANAKDNFLIGTTYCNGEKVTEEVAKNRGVVGALITSQNREPYTQQRVSGSVFTQRKLMSISNAYNNPLFLKSEDEKCNFKTRNLLCFPIVSEGKGVGCIQVRNKYTGDYNVFDENSSVYFAQIVQEALQYADVLQKIKEEGEKLAIASKHALYRYDFRDNDVKHLLLAMRRRIDGFDSPKFNPRAIPEHRIGIVLMAMFEDLHFIEAFNIERKTLANFLVIVEKGYTNRPYHNWMHAFVVTHFVYATIRFLKLIERNILSNLEAMALIISAICHRLDHKSMPNTFRAAEDSTLAVLYAVNQSMSEHYHFVQLIHVLNTHDCNFLQNLSGLDFCMCVDLIKNNMICSGVNTKKQEALLTRGFRPNAKETKNLFCSLLMACGDFCDHIRDWQTEQQVAFAMLDEYFHQDQTEEFSMRPNLFIDFLKDVCERPYQLIARMFVDMYFCVQGLYDNIANWEQFKPREPSVISNLPQEQKISFDDA